LGATNEENKCFVVKKILLKKVAVMSPTSFAATKIAASVSLCGGRALSFLRKAA